MAKKSIETLVGFFVLLGILGLVFLAFKAANLGSFERGNTYMVQARFDNIGGLKVRAPVRSAGVHVGRVTGISLDHKTYLAIVTMDIQHDFLFPKDSSVKVLTSGLLGDQYIGIEPGSADDNLVEGGRIVQTQSAVVLENLIGQLVSSKAGEAAADTGAKK